MANVHTMRDLSSGHRLGSAREIELEEALCISSKSISEFTNKYNDLLGAYSNFEKRVNKEKAKLHRNLEQADTNNGELFERIHNLTDELTSLHSERDSLKYQITRKDISLAEFKAKNASKLKEIKDLQSKMKALETKSFLAQKDLSEIDSLRLELDQAKKNLTLKNHELECMEKGGELKDNTFKRALDDLSSARFTLIENNSLLQAENLGLKDTIAKISATQDVEVSGGTNYEANTSPNDLSQASIGGAETVVTKSNIPSSSLAPAIPIVANSLMSPMVIYSILTLLLIAVIWFVVGKKIWNSWKKTDPLHSYSQTRYQ